MRRIVSKFFAVLASMVLVLQVCVAPFALAYADETTGNPSDATNASSDDAEIEKTLKELNVSVSSDGKAAVVGDGDFALDDFSRAQKGTNSAATDNDGNDVYLGYRYYISSTPGSVVAIGMSNYVVVYVPKDAASEHGLSLNTASDTNALKALLVGLDVETASGGSVFDVNGTWYFTSDTEYTVNGITFKFDQEVKKSQYYACVIGADGSDITDETNPLFDKPNHADSARLALPSSVNIVQKATGLAAFGEFLSTLDWSPLWITLKTTLTAIVFIFILGLAAAYFTLHISPKAQNIFDSIFTIPMVLPPTVCGFVLLFICGSKTPFGQFFIDIGFPLIFSWPATVIAAVVVAFPLMYRNARGAFENLDPNMLDAAKTLGWSNQRIFFRLMLPLSWSSIAAATVLAFARALGEFGATLFLAGNYLGITRTIPIAIYFEWMNGNDAVAWFWVAIIIIFSFVVILFINLWSNHTTKYRKRDASN